MHLDWGLNLQPRPVPWPGIEPETFCFEERCPDHWATPVRAKWREFFIFQFCKSQPTVGPGRPKSRCWQRPVLLEVPGQVCSLPLQVLEAAGMSWLTASSSNQWCQAGSSQLFLIFVASRCVCIQAMFIFTHWHALDLFPCLLQVDLPHRIFCTPVVSAGTVDLSHCNLLGNLSTNILNLSRKAVSFWSLLTWHLW